VCLFLIHIWINGKITRGNLKLLKELQFCELMGTNLKDESEVGKKEIVEEVGCGEFS
jgi:hypothetical protein